MTSLVRSRNESEKCLCQLARLTSSPEVHSYGDARRLVNAHVVERLSLGHLEFLVGSTQPRHSQGYSPTRSPKKTNREPREAIHNKLHRSPNLRQPTATLKRQGSRQTSRHRLNQQRLADRGWIDIAWTDTG